MKKKKKGFTLVELVIVIAVIAILAAVLIPTFSSVIKNANNSADLQLVNNLNIVASTHSVSGTDNEFETADNIRKMLAEEGISATSLKTKNKNNVIVYNTETQQFECTALDDLVDESTSNTFSVGYYLEELFGYSGDANKLSYKILVSTGGNDTAEAIHALHNLKSGDIKDDITKALKKIKNTTIKERVKYIVENSVFITDKIEDSVATEAIGITFDGDTPLLSYGSDITNKSRVIFYEQAQEFNLDTLPLTFDRIIIPNNVTYIWSDINNNSTYLAGNTNVVNEDTVYAGTMTVDNAKLNTAATDHFNQANLTMDSTIVIDFNTTEGKLIWSYFNSNDFTKFAAIDADGNNSEPNSLKYLIAEAKDIELSETENNDITIVSMSDGKDTYGTDNEAEVKGGTYQLTVDVNGTYENILFKYQTVQVGTGTDAVSNWRTIEDALNDVSSGTITVKADTNFTSFTNVYPSNTYTVANGVTLLVPYDIDLDADKYYDESLHDWGGYKATNKTREETLATQLQLELYVSKDVAIINNGTINIGGKTNGGAGGTPYAGYTKDAYAQITLGEGAEIKSYGSINSYGFIKEEVENNSSKVIMTTGTLKMPFVVVEQRGGTAYANMMFKGTSKMLTVEYPTFSSDSLETSPFNRFFMENVTPELTIESGANLVGRFNIYVTDTNADDIKLVGSNGNNNLIQLDNGSKVVSKYSVSTQVTSLNIYGNMTLQSLSIPLELGDIEGVLKDKLGSFLGSIASAIAGDMANITLATESIKFPLSWYWNVTLKPFEDGRSATVDSTKQDIKILPGASLTIEKGVTLNIGELAVYDSSDMPKETTTSNFWYEDENAAGEPIGNGQLIVNGTLNVNTIAGYVQTEQDGAVLNVVSGTSIEACEVIQQGNNKDFQSLLPMSDGSTYQKDVIISLTLDMYSDDGSLTKQLGQAEYYESSNGGWVQQETYTITITIGSKSAQESTFSSKTHYAYLTINIDGVEKQYTENTTIRVMPGSKVTIVSVVESGTKHSSGSCTVGCTVADTTVSNEYQFTVESDTAIATTIK